MSSIMGSAAGISHSHTMLHSYEGQNQYTHGSDIDHNDEVQRITENKKSVLGQTFASFLVDRKKPPLTSMFSARSSITKPFHPNVMASGNELALMQAKRGSAVVQSSTQGAVTKNSNLPVFSQAIVDRQKKSISSSIHSRISQFV